MDARLARLSKMRVNDGGPAVQPNPNVEVVLRTWTSDDGRTVSYPIAGVKSVEFWKQHVIMDMVLADYVYGYNDEDTGERVIKPTLHQVAARYGINYKAIEKLSTEEKWFNLRREVLADRKEQILALRGDLLMETYMDAEKDSVELALMSFQDAKEIWERIKANAEEMEVSDGELLKALATIARINKDNASVIVRFMQDRLPDEGSGSIRGNIQIQVNSVHYDSARKDDPYGDLEVITVDATEHSGRELDEPEAEWEAVPDGDEA